MAYLSECLATGTSIDQFSGSVHSVAKTILKFLGSLEDPVIPSSLTKSALDKSHSLEMSKA
eukprot:Awhi_evm1s13559